MRILLIGTNYSPDLGPSAPLYTMLSEGLVRRGHDVTVITMVPHYPTGQVSEAFRGRLKWTSVENGVKVIRVWLPSVNRSKLGQRLLQFLFYQVGATFASLGQKFDVVLAVSSSLSVWLPFAWTVVLQRKPAVYSVQDVYPNVGIHLGIFRYKPVIAFVTFLERFCLHHSQIVQIISESFRQDLRSLGIDDSHMELIYNWVDTDLIRPLPRINSFSQEFRLTDPFVVLYAGNIGLSQGLEHVLAAAESFRKDNDVKFVFVGDGAAKEQLLERTRERDLFNVQFIPFQPRERLPEVLASADISLISLRKNIGFGSLPSKTYSILASGRPILASVDDGCETWELIARAQAGLCIYPENSEEMIKAITKLKNNPPLREQLGQNGRRWAEKHHSPQTAASQYEKLLSHAISKQRERVHLNVSE